MFLRDKSIIIFAGLVAALVLGGVWYAQKPSLERPPVVGGNGEQVADSNDEVVISDWKTYRNEEYGFEFRYPKDWLLVDCSNFTSDNLRIYLNASQISCNDRGGRINITTYNKNYLKQVYEKNSINNTISIGQKNLSQMVIEQEITGDEGEKLISEPMQKVIRTFLPYQNEDVVISYSEIFSIKEGVDSSGFIIEKDYSDIYTQIILTLKFIDN